MKALLSRIPVVLMCLALSMGTLAAKPDKKPDPLEHFFQTVQTYKASFTQVVLDEALNPIQESSGTLYIARPKRFRWDYDTPVKQQIISDGKRIWVYDIELKQVTVRALEGALGDTPAILLAGRGRLADSFTVKHVGQQGELEWMQMVPKKDDGGYQDIRLGFDNGVLRQLVMVDRFGQTTRVTLKDNAENRHLDLKRFSFTPPAGVDVVQQ